MDKVTMTKSERQRIGATKWRDNKGSGLWVFPTGFGKTIGTIREIIAQMLQKAPYKVIILVHRTKLLSQWNERLNEEISPKLRHLVTVQTVQWYVSNHATDVCDLLVVDELHKFYSEDFIEYVNGNRIKFKFNLGLTATPKDRAGRHKLLSTIYPIVDTITQEEAIAQGWISKFIEFNLPVSLSNDEVLVYQEAIEQIANAETQLGAYGYGAITRAQKIIYGGEDANGKHYAGFMWAMMYAKSKGWTIELDKEDPINKEWNPNTVINYGQQLFAGYRKRETVLNHCAAKYNATVKILRKFKHLKAMCFSESTMFADSLATKYKFQHKDDKMVVFHSQLPSVPMKDDNGEWILYKSGKHKGEKRIFGLASIKTHIIDQFVNNKNNVRILSTARLLDEGFDCEDIRLGIITSRSSNSNQQTQRGGRIKRITPEAPTETMLIVNIYVANTDDEKKLQRAQANNTHRAIPIQDIDDIDFDSTGEDEIDSADL